MQERPFFLKIFFFIPSTIKVSGDYKFAPDLMQFQHQNWGRTGGL